MRVGLHLGTARGSGSASVCRHLLAHLVALGDGHQWEAWVPGEWSLPASHARLHPTRPGLHHKLLTELVSLRRALPRLDVLFSMVDTSLVGCRRPHLLLVQQAYLAYDAHELDFPLPSGFRRKIALMRAYLRAALPTVSAISVQTHDMAEHLARTYRFERRRIHVIPSAVAPLSAEGLPPVGGPPFLLTVSAPGAHKNLELVPDVLAALPEPLCWRLTVRPGEVPAVVERAERLGVRHRLVFEGAVPPDRVRQLLRDAAVVVLPSRLESFGLPYYEALSLGARVVAADRPFAREACGSAASYADPDDALAFARAVEERLGADREGAAAAARARFDEVHLGWPQVARAHLDLLEGLARA